MKTSKIKQYIFPTITILVLMTGIYLLNQKQTEETSRINPKPTEIAVSTDESEADEWKHRLEWIETMHKCDSTINWRTVNYKNRIDKNKFRKENYSTKSNNINIADGLLIGDWRETGSNNLAGRTHYVEIDQTEDSIYCASSGGNIWKADKLGNAWRVLNDDFKIDDIKMIRKIENGGDDRLLVSSGGWGTPGFYYSDDDGSTWTASTGLNNIADWGYVIKTMVANDAQRTIYLLALEWHNGNWEKQTTVYVSTDKGISFTQKASFLESAHGSEGLFDIWCDPEDEICYMAKNNEIYYFNASYNLELISSYSITNPGNVLLSGCKTETDTYLYTAVYADDYVDFYQSSDAGATWSIKGNIAANPFMKNSFSVSQKDPNTLYYGGVECYRSSNGASNWTILNTWGEYYSDIENKLHADIPGFNSFIDSENNEFVYINTDGGTYISHDQLATVENISMYGLNIGQFYSVYSHRSNSNYIFAGSQDQGYQLCNDNTGTGSASFTQILSGDYGHIISANGGNSIWMVYPGFAAYYPSSTGSPYTSFWWEFDCSGQFWIPPLMAHPTQSNIAYLGGGTTGSGTHIFELTSVGSVVNVLELAYDFSGTTGASAISAMAFSPINSDYRYVMNGNGEFFISTNAGIDWTLTTGFNGPDGHYLYGAAIIPSNTELGKVYVGGSGYSNPPAFISTNNGASFTSISNGIPSTMIYEMAISPNDEFLFAATDAGPYVYISENNQWYDLAENSAPDQTYWSVDYQAITQTVRFASYGRGIWDLKITVGLVNITEENTTELKVYPNPASNFIQVEGAKDRVQIFSIFGKLIIDTDLEHIDVSKLSNGMYILKTGNRKVKFIKN